MPDTALATELDSIDDREAQQRQTERERLQRVLADITRRQDSILRQAADGDPDDPFTQGLRGSYNDLETQKKATLATVAELDAANEAEPATPSTDDAALLEHLPHLALNLAHAPEQLLRRLFEITQLTVTLHGDSDEATITIKLPADDLPHIAHAAETITQTTPPTHKTPGNAGEVGRVDAVRAPGQTRTDTGRILSPLPLPIGLRGRLCRSAYASRDQSWERGRRRGAAPLKLAHPWKS